jgi:hypothetical protein
VNFSLTRDACRAEQRKSAIRAANKELERADDLVRGVLCGGCTFFFTVSQSHTHTHTQKIQEMDMETRGAPPTYRTKLTSRLRGYQAEVQKLKKDLVR